MHDHKIVLVTSAISRLGNRDTVYVFGCMGAVCMCGCRCGCVGLWEGVYVCGRGGWGGMGPTNDKSDKITYYAKSLQIQL